jgi:hypothetical protein
MARWQIDIPDELISQLDGEGYSVAEAVIKALEHYLHAKSSESKRITNDTWQLCGSFTIANPEIEYVVGQSENGQPITNYAENVDRVLY